MAKYSRIWPLIESYYKQASLLFFITPPLIVLTIAYLLVPGFRQLLGSPHGWFVLMLLTGVFILLVNSAWLFSHRRYAVLLNKAKKTLPTNCPFCGREFHFDIEERRLPFDFPAAKFHISCSFCSTHLVSEYPYDSWVFTKVDTVLNSTFAWLYQGEKLSREDLNQILNRQHTDNAKTKLRASGNADLVHIWFDKPTARTITKLRTGPLEKIVSGDISALTELNSDILYTVPDVSISFFKDPGDLILRKRENVILTVAPVRLASHRTNQSDDQFYTKDTGSFFITNQRIGFRGKTHRSNLAIDMIDDLDHQADKIVVRSQHRKTPDYYLDLDGELIYCVIKGLLKANEVP